MTVLENLIGGNMCKHIFSDFPTPAGYLVTLPISNELNEWNDSF